MTGEEKEVKVTFPEDYHADEVAGKEAVFKVKVNKIETKVLRAELMMSLPRKSVNSTLCQSSGRI
jgi:hypothetical protein